LGKLAAKGVQFLGEDEARAFPAAARALTAFRERRGRDRQSAGAGRRRLAQQSARYGNPELIAEAFKTGAKPQPSSRRGPRPSPSRRRRAQRGVSAALQGGLANKKECARACSQWTLKDRQLDLKDIRYAGLDASSKELTFEAEATQAWTSTP
jgi:hypothetical protein